MAERYEIRFSGAGGQGLITAGIILAEAASIIEGKSAVQSQSYGPEARGGASKSEVIIADGLSEDGTRNAIAEFEQAHPDLSLRVVDNVSRTIPAGLNTALRSAMGEIIIRLDAHSSPYPGYVAECVAALE
ncbi:MAG: glycosyltransferase, partial [Deltaproteobacteria bacterium]|nr:glycosyltransferase [Deltaproteobacteria bacterium]